MMNISNRFSPGNFGLPGFPQIRRQSSAFEKYLDVNLQRQNMRELPPGQMLSSVFMQFLDEYNQWKAQQPEMNLSDSQGWTEENLAFLRERYGGNLSANEIYDALETMEDLGLLTQRAKQAAEGITWVRVSLQGLQGGVYVSPTLDPDSRGAWLHGFDEAPMVGFHTLEDILSWAKAFREEDYPEFITHAEALARNWI